MLKIPTITNYTFVIKLKKTWLKMPSLDEIVEFRNPKSSIQEAVIAPFACNKNQWKKKVFHTWMTML